jgi:hypothetical protein
MVHIETTSTFGGTNGIEGKLIFGHKITFPPFKHTGLHEAGMQEMK